MRLSTVILPWQRWNEARSTWERADDYGLHAAYTYDHLSWRNFRERPWFTMVPTLVAAAQVTSTIRLGPLVTSPNFRHPLVLAKDLLAIDDVSNGRLSIGVGSGGTGYDSTVLGETPWTVTERHQRFVEFTRTLDTLLREPSSTVEGAYYPVVESRQIPGPVQLPRPPLFVSALGPQSMALCAEVADGWISLAPANDGSSSFELLARQVARMDQRLAEVGRDPGSLERIHLDFESSERPLSSYGAFIDWAARLKELGCTEAVVHWPVVDSQFDSDSTVFERVATEGHETLRSWS